MRITPAKFVRQSGHRRPAGPDAQSRSAQSPQRPLHPQLPERQTLATRISPNLKVLRSSCFRPCIHTVGMCAAFRQHLWPHSMSTVLKGCSMQIRHTSSEHSPDPRSHSGTSTFVDSAKLWFISMETSLWTRFNSSPFDSESLDLTEGL